MFFQLHRTEGNPPTFHFSLFLDDESIELVSRPYPTKDDCLEGVIQAIADLRDRQAESNDFWVERQGQYYIEVNSEEEVAIAVSTQSFPTEAEAQAGIVQLRAEAEQGEFEGAFRDEAAATMARPLHSEVVRTYDFDLDASESVVVFSNALPAALRFQFYLLGKADQYFFLFKSREGGEETNFLFSPAFSSESKRNRHIGMVVNNAGNRFRYREHEEASGFYFTLHSRGNVELARSRYFTSEAEMRTLISAFIAEADWWAENLESYYAKKRRQITYGAGRYDLERQSTTGVSGFEKYEAEREGAKQHFFLLNGVGGAALLFSEGYRMARGRDNGIRSVIRNAMIDERFRLKEADGQYYFTLLAGNRQEIGRSRNFDTPAAAAEAIRWIQANAAHWAEAYSVNLEAGGRFSKRERIKLLIEEQPVAAAVTPAVDEPKRSGFAGWLWPFVAAVLAILLLAALLRNCNRTGQEGASEEPAVVRDTVTIREGADFVAYYRENALLVLPDSVAAPAGTLVAAEKEWTDTGLDAATFNFWIGSAEGRILHFLNDPTATGSRTFILERVKFPHNSPKLNKGGFPQTFNLQNILKSYPTVKIRFHGYIDPGENDEYTGPYATGTASLSMLRARCLYRKIVKCGVPASQMSFVGHGADHPLRTGNTEEDRRVNRRVEVEVFK